MKKLVLAAAFAAVSLPALAQNSYAPAPYVDEQDYPAVTGSLAPAPSVPPGYMVQAERPWLNPAAEGNAREINKPVPNYGNVAGGYLNALTPE